jgi:hypothetical protein
MDFNLPPDVIVLLALEMNLDTILNYCLVNKKFNSLVCDSQNFWRIKYQKDFPGSKLLPKNMKPKEFYKYIAKSLDEKILPPNILRTRNPDYELIYAAARNNSLETICNAQNKIYILCRQENTWINILNYLFHYIRGNPETYKEKYFPNLSWRDFFLHVIKTPSILQTGFF